MLNRCSAGSSVARGAAAPLCSRCAPTYARRRPAAAPIATPLAAAAAARRTRRGRFVATATAAAPAEQAEEGAACSSGEAPQPQFRILFQDEHLVAIEKPSGMHVHPPEDGYPIPPEENTMRLLKQQLGGTYLFPVHRLDRPTSGVVVYCLTRDAASGFGLAARERRIDKTYIAMCRGYAQPSGQVDKALDEAPCVTQYETLGTVEIPHAVGSFAQARYSLLKVRPLSGHYHQIRRHLNRIDRPILGDTDHGDRAHNRLFSGPTFNSPGLFLKCAEMAFDHPVHGPGERVVLQTQDWEPRWHLAFSMFGLCPTSYY